MFGLVMFGLGVVFGANFGLLILSLVMSNRDESVDMT